MAQNDINILEASGLSTRSLPKVSAFLPILKTVDKHFTVASEVDIDMAMGENWLIRKPLIAICKKAVEEMGPENLNYPLGMGATATLLSAFASFFNQFFSPTIPVMPEHVIPFAGASTCLDSLLYTICDAGDSILLPSPFWGGYIPFTQFRDDVNIVTTTKVPWRSSLSIDIVTAIKEAYATAVDPKRIKALLINNPNNPIGRCYSPTVLRELMSFCNEKGLHYVSDELFAISTFGGEGEEKFTSALSLIDDGEKSIINPSRVHVIYSMSKDFGSGGVRMGCIVSPRNRAVLEGSMISNYLQHSVLNSLYLTALFTSPELPFIVASLKSQLSRNYALLIQSFDHWGLEYIPTHAGFHVFVRVAKEAKSWEEEAAIVKKLLDVGVMVIPGKNFGGIDGEMGWLRVCFSIEEEKIKIGLERMGKVLHLGTRKVTNKVIVGCYF